MSVIELQKTLTEVMRTSTRDLKKMGSNGKALIKNKYDIEAVGRQIIDIYKTVNSAKLKI